MNKFVAFQYSQHLVTAEHRTLFIKHVRGDSISMSCMSEAALNAHRHKSRNVQSAATQLTLKRQNYSHLSALC
jgi:hypothetical protein